MFFKKYSKFIYIFGILLLFVLAFLLRSKMFLAGDIFFLPDQGRDMQLVRDIVENKSPVLIGGHTGFGGLFHGPLWFYLITPFFIASSGNPFWSLVPVYFLINTALFAALFIICWHLYGKAAGFISAFFFSVSQIFIKTVPFTSNSQVMPLLFALYLWAIISYLRGKDYYLIIAVFFMGAGMHFESAFAITLSFSTLLAIFLKKSFPDIKILILSAGVLLLTVSNFILFDIRNQFIQTKAFLKLIHAVPDPGNPDAKYILLENRIEDRFKWLIDLFSAPLFTDSFSGLILVILITFIGGTVVYVKKTTKKDFHILTNEALLLILIPIMSLMFYLFFYKAPLHAHHILSLYIVPMLLLGIIVSRLLLVSRALAYLSIVIIFVINFIPATNYIYNSYISNSKYIPTSNGSLINQITVVDWIYKDAESKTFGYFVYDPPIVTYGFDYLMWWIGKSKYNYVPRSQKAELTYMILNPSDDGSQAFWLKHTINTSREPISVKNFPSGIKVAKFSFTPEDPPVDPNYHIDLIFR
jgi:hypothetical protein